MTLHFNRFCCASWRDGARKVVVFALYGRRNVTDVFPRCKSRPESEMHGLLGKELDQNLVFQMMEYFHLIKISSSGHPRATQALHKTILHFQKF